MLKRLKEVNENLKKYTSVNRKALDQYVSFNEQRANLVGRKEELTRDTSAIEELVQSLDSQKVQKLRRCSILLLSTSQLLPIRPYTPEIAICSSSYSRNCNTTYRRRLFCEHSGALVTTLRRYSQN